MSTKRKRQTTVIPRKIPVKAPTDDYKIEREKQRDLEIEEVNKVCEKDITVYNSVLNKLTNKFINKNEGPFVHKIHGTGYYGDVFEPPIVKAVDTFKQRVAEKGYIINVETKKTYNSYYDELSGCWLEITVK